MRERAYRITSKLLRVPLLTVAYAHGSLTADMSESNCGSQSAAIHYFGSSEPRSGPPANLLRPPICSPARAA